MANFVSDLLNILTGMQGETVARKPGISYGRHAMSRIGRRPVEFIPEPEVLEDIVGLFTPGKSPGTGDIQVAVGEGRSPRQIGRTLAHEDMHAVYDKLNRGDSTHILLRNPQNPDMSMVEGLPDTEDIKRLMRLFKLLD